MCRVMLYRLSYMVEAGCGGKTRNRRYLTAEEEVRMRCVRTSELLVQGIVIPEEGAEP